MRSSPRIVIQNGDPRPHRGGKSEKSQFFSEIVPDVSPARALTNLPIPIALASGAVCMHIHRPIPRPKVRTCSRTSTEMGLMCYFSIATLSNGNYRPKMKTSNLDSTNGKLHCRGVDVHDDNARTMLLSQPTRRRITAKKIMPVRRVGGYGKR